MDRRSFPDHPDAAPDRRAAVRSMVEALAGERSPWAIVAVVRGGHRGRTVEVISIVAPSVTELRSQMAAEWGHSAEDTWIEATKRGVSRASLVSD